MNLVDRVKNILMSPQTEWPKIAEEAATTQSIYVGYVVILAAIGPIALALRGGLAGAAAAVFAYIVALVVVFLVAWIADALAPSFGGEKGSIQSLKLVAYSYTAAWIAGIFNLIPFIGGIVGVLAGIYSLYTFYLGAPVLKKCATDKAVAYTIVVVICVIVLWALLGVVLMSAMFGGVAGMGGMGMWR